MPVTVEKIRNIAQNWLAAWNHRDLNTLLQMVAPDARLAKIYEFFEPIIVDGVQLTGQSYVKARFMSHLKVLESSQITFLEPYELKVGEYYVDQRYKMSTGHFVHEILSLREDGLIDQISRDIDLYGLSR